MTIQIDRLRTYQTPKQKYSCRFCGKQSTNHRLFGGKLIIACRNCWEVRK